MDKWDVFWEALLAYNNWDRSKFFIKDINDNLYNHSLKRYFRKCNNLSKVEDKLISLSYGDILDVGCLTWNYIPALMKKGKVLGIDVSSNAISIANSNWLSNCIVADVFKLDLQTKFDTITLLENNLWMAWSISNLKKLLNILSNLLKDDGQILNILSQRSKNYKYIESKLIPIYKEVVWDEFYWLNLSSDFLYDFCKKYNLNLEVLSANKYNKLIRIKKM